MFLRVHLNIVLWKATDRMLCKELAVATIQNVDFGICELGVLVSVGSTILLADMTGHDGSTMCRVFAMEDQQGLPWQTLLKELTREQLFVIVIDSTVNMPAIELILKPAIDDHPLIKLTVEFSIQNRQQGLLGDSRNAVRLTFLEEMRQCWLMEFVNVHDRVKVA